LRSWMTTWNKRGAKPAQKVVDDEVPMRQLGSMWQGMRQDVTDILSLGSSGDSPRHRTEYAGICGPQTVGVLRMQLLIDAESTHCGV
jgi:hypothetical protein